MRQARMSSTRQLMCSTYSFSNKLADLGKKNSTKQSFRSTSTNIVATLTFVHDYAQFQQFVVVELE